MKVNKSTSVIFKGQQDIELLDLITLLAFQQIRHLKSHASEPRISVAGLNKPFHVNVVETTLTNVRAALNRSISSEVRPFMDVDDKGRGM